MFLHNHRPSRLTTLIAAVAAAATMVITSARAAEIEVSVSKLRNATGKVVVCVWTDAAEFPACDTKEPFRRVEVKATDTKPIIIGDLPDGTYAVSAYHDETGKLERNFMGIPKFGVGLHPDGWPFPIGKPRFAKNTFNLAGGRVKRAIEMKYF